MPRSDDSQLSDKALRPAGAQPITATPAIEPAAAHAAAHACTCTDYQRDMVCDHVLMAAAVRMVRRMINAHGEKPH